MINIENNEENQILSILNKSANQNVNDSIELFDLKNNAIPKNKVNDSLKIIEDYKINSGYSQNNDSIYKKALSDIGRKETQNDISPVKSHKSMTEANSVNLIDI